MFYRKGINNNSNAMSILSFINSNAVIVRDMVQALNAKFKHVQSSIIIPAVPVQVPFKTSKV